MQVVAIEIPIDHLLDIGPPKAVLLCEMLIIDLTLVKKVHSYKVPEIIALSIVGGNPDYLEWVEKRVG